MNVRTKRIKTFVEYYTGVDQIVRVAVSFICKTWYHTKEKGAGVTDPLFV
jgi:hypothetical protein